MLNEDQARVKKDILEWFYNSPNNEAVLHGVGGTGKTYLINNILQTLNMSVLVISPTHKALQQIEVGADKSTIHKD